MPTVSQLDVALGDRYRIERELGRGGMATVFLARDHKHDRHVAIKVLKPELANAVGAERFLREIGIASRLQHPHVLTLIDSGEAIDPATGDRALYYVMPYVDGESLRDRINRDGAMVPADATRLLRDVADAMAAAHDAGIVHRDIKPENILVAGTHALVVDFGVAKAMSDARNESSLTATGVSLGSPSYMAPEQVAGESTVDHRADIYSFGVLAYEMVTGTAPFTGSVQTVLAAHVTKPPRPPRDTVPAIPATLEQIVLRCLEKNPAARYQTARDVLAALDGFTAETTARPARRPMTRRMVVLGAIAVAAVASTIGVLLRHSAKERWVNETAIPNIMRLAEIGETDSAFALATEATKVAPSNSVLKSLWPRFSRFASFTTVPPGARMERARFDDTTSWEFLGTTPTGAIRIPIGLDRYRFTKAGFRPVRWFFGGIPPIPAGPLPDTIRLDALDAPHPEMNRIPGGRVGGELLQLRSVSSRRVSDFYVDRLETTNAEYKKFVDAGGYTRREFWKEPFVKSGRTLTWEEAMALFTDRTGRRGPATWEGGSIPPGSEELPVGGLSWYEAAAYAAFTGKSLPTLYHWVRAASPGSSAYVVHGSRFDADAPTRGGAFGAVGPWGLFDAAGNVREWCLNLDGSDKRYLLGGGFNDGPFRFGDAVALPPFDRSASNGVRLVIYRPGDPELASASTPVSGDFRDFFTERQPTAAALASYRQYYEYDHTPLNARVDAVDSSETDWIAERVSVDAAYGGERLPLRIYRPRGANKPLQSVLLFPASDALFATKGDDAYADVLRFVLRNGRAIVQPIYKSTYDRNDAFSSNAPDSTIAYRDHVVMWGKDARRAVDYLMTRTDFDSSRIAFFGISWGARLGPVIMGVEPRIKVGVLYVGGLAMGPARPEADPFSFLSHVTAPVLMLNGLDDQIFPVETSQKPLFKLLGATVDRKRYRVYSGGHFVPRTALIAETLQWLDKYLGPAK